MRGNVFKKGTRYYIRYDLGKDSNGKRVQKVESGFDTKRQAEKALRERITELENSFANKVERCTLEQYLREWLVFYCEARLARNTVNGYRVNIENHIIPNIEKIPLYKLQPEDIQKMYEELSKKGLSSTTILYVHNVLRKALNSAVKRRVLTNNVINYVDAPIKAKFKSKVLSINEISRLLLASKCTIAYHPILLSVTLGLRRGEVLGLQWSDIDWDLKTLTIQRTATFYKQEFVLSDVKTQNSKRTLLLADSIIEVLKRQKLAQERMIAELGNWYNPYNLVICRLDGSPMSSSFLNKQFKAVLQVGNLPNIRFHDLRHTNATLMLKQNIPAKIVSSMLGHSTIAITLDTYSHVLTDMQQPAVNVIEELLKPK